VGKGEEVTNRKRFAPLLIVMMLLTVSLLATACGGAAVAKEGDTVKVDYILTLDDGTEVDSSLNASYGHVEPLEFTIGSGQLLVGFEQAVIGLSVGESTTVKIPADEAYGPWSEDMVVTLNWSQLQEGLEPEVGQELYTQDMYGQVSRVIVINVSEEGVTVDANHPLAKEDLNFEIWLVEIL
jgi:peptidylprolyl isomerase